jgi:hypothetical protein
VGLLPLTLARLLVERATYKISSFQNIRSARLVLAHQRRKVRKVSILSFRPKGEIFLRSLAFVLHDWAARHLAPLASWQE